MLCTKVMVSPEYIPNDLLSVGDRLATIAQNCQSLACTPLWGFPWFLLQLQPWAHQLFEDYSDAHGPSIIPTDKNQGGSSPVNEVPTRRHTSCLSAFPKTALSASQVCDLISEGSPHLTGTTGHLDQSPCDVRVMPRTSSALPHNVPYWPFEPSHFHLQTNTDRLCYVWKWLPILCTVLSVTVSVRLPPEMLYPSKHYILLLTCPDSRKCASSENQTWSKKSGLFSIVSQNHSHIAVRFVMSAPVSFCFIWIW